ncbi:hypothetical protein GF406_11005 [candidate division KSB1 bacterium]|nr:hypothetical protein [candidate division KSB1 bacterium]
MKYIVDIAYLFGILAYSPRILYRMCRQDRYKEGWDQRLGKIYRKNPDKSCIWIHAVSVGEVNATRTLVSKLKEQFPDFDILITSTTDTGLARAKALYEKDLNVSYFPFDISWVMKRAFVNIKPAIILLMELEIWPNMAQICQEKKIPLVVVNGRLSDKSYPRYRKIRPITKWMFSKATSILAQTEEYARRFIDLGCPADRVQVTSSLKYDTAQTEGPVPGAERLQEQIALGDNRLLVAGGTGPGEEQILLDVFRELKKQTKFEDLTLAIVPRKPERFDEVAQLIENTGIKFIRYSQLKESDSVTDQKPTIFLGDTMGDLKKFYAIATVVFVGRSLVKMGGSDMMEPTGLGKCTLFGPFTFNFKQTVDVLLKGQGAIEVQNQNELLEKSSKCLIDHDFADTIAQNGRNVIQENKGATQKTIEIVKSILHTGKL